MYYWWNIQLRLSRSTFRAEAFSFQPNSRAYEIIHLQYNTRLFLLEYKDVYTTNMTRTDIFLESLDLDGEWKSVLRSITVCKVESIRRHLRA